MTNFFISSTLQNQERQFVYLNVMDSIMKNVQGQYIDAFANVIHYLIGVVLQRAKNANNSDEQKKIVKMFKTWEVLGLLDQNLLNTIAENHALRQLVSSGLLASATHK